MFSATETYGPSEPSKLWSYWFTVKSYIKDMINLPVKILQLRKANEKLLASKNISQEDKSKLILSMARLKPMQVNAEAIRAKIDEHLPSWQKAESSSSSVKGFGIIPLLVLGVAAASALAYIAVTGISLLKQYKQEEAIMQQVANKTLTITEAQSLIKSVKSSGGFMESFGSSLGGNIGLILGIGILAVGGYYLYSSGLLKRK